VICFTFSRTSYYGPGEGYAMLEKFLKKELPDVKITLTNKINCFYFDNEAYRYLVACKKGHTFQQDTENSYLESWKKSVEQSNLMWNQIRKMLPHDLGNTISLNNARKLILSIAEPMALIKKLTIENIEMIKEQRKRINSREADVEKLKNISSKFRAKKS